VTAKIQRKNETTAKNSKKMFRGLSFVLDGPEKGAFRARAVARRNETADTRRTQIEVKSEE
jgi:hypothetical protein